MLSSSFEPSKFIQLLDNRRFSSNWILLWTGAFSYLKGQDPLRDFVVGVEIEII